MCAAVSLASRQRNAVNCPGPLRAASQKSPTVCQEIAWHCLAGFAIIFNGNPTFPNDVVEFTKLSITNYFVSDKTNYVYNIVMEDDDYPWFTVNDF